MMTDLIRLASHLDASGQYDLADRMERLASIHRAPQSVPFTTIPEDLAKRLSNRRERLPLARHQRSPHIEEALRISNDLYRRSAVAARMVADGTPMEEACLAAGLPDVPTMHALWRQGNVSPYKTEAPQGPTKDEQRAMALLVADLIKRGIPLTIAVYALGIGKSDMVKRLMFANLTAEERDEIDAAYTHRSAPRPTTRTVEVEKLIERAGRYRLQGYTTPQIASMIGEPYDNSTYDLKITRDLLRDFAARNPQHADVIEQMARDEMKIKWPKEPPYRFRRQYDDPAQSIRNLEKSRMKHRNEIRSPELRPAHWPNPAEVDPDNMPAWLLRMIDRSEGTSPSVT